MRKQYTLTSNMRRKGTRGSLKEYNISRHKVTSKSATITHIPFLNMKISHKDTPKNANWFAVEAKSFEITAEGEGKKTKYVITERSRGKVSWIRFGEEGLFNFMKNVDECRNASIPAGRSIVWREHR